MSFNNIYQKEEKISERGVYKVLHKKENKFYALKNY